MKKENYQEYFITLNKLINLLDRMKIRQIKSHHASFIGDSSGKEDEPNDYLQKYYNILRGDSDKEPDFDLMKNQLKNLKDMLSQCAHAEGKMDSSPKSVIEDDIRPSSIISETTNQEEDVDVSRSTCKSAGEENVYLNSVPVISDKPVQAEQSYNLPFNPVKDENGLQYSEAVHIEELPPYLKAHIDKIFDTYDKKIEEELDEKLKEFKKNIDSTLHDYVTKDFLYQKIQLIEQKIRTEMVEILSDRSNQSKEENKRIESARVLPTKKAEPNNSVTALLSKSDIRSCTSSDTMRERRSSVNDETYRAMQELANEYNSVYKYTDGKHLNLKAEFAKTWASSGKSFQSEEEAKKIPLVEFQGNYTYLAVEAEGDEYYLMPSKGMKLTPGLIQHAAYDQFFAYKLPEGNRELKIHLDEPAIVEKRGDEYYLVRRGSISF